ncbi:MAG: tetratricopeptide repeat protein [Planctomycetota bacterium]
MNWSTMTSATILAATILLAAVPIRAVVQDPPVDESGTRLIEEELLQNALMLRRGEVRKAMRSLEEILAEDPSNARARLMLARGRLDRAEYTRALSDATAALADAASDADLARACVRTRGEILVALGRAAEAVEALEKPPARLAPESDARDAWVLGSAHWAAGQREKALASLEAGARTADEQPWDGLLARGRCLHRLGRISEASRSFVAADEASAGSEGGSEPEVLTALGDLYFEADREVEAAKGRSAADLYREAGRLAPGFEPALLGLFRLHRWNWLRRSRSAQDIQDEILGLRPESIEGRIAAASADLDDGRLKSARERLAALELLAPGRREVRTISAALAWVEHRPKDCEEALAALAVEDPADATPEREVGRHLSELYRFAEALPFAKRATERDPRDHEAWKELGRAQANTGDEDGARVSLDRAKEEAAGRQDAWRDNLRLVLKRMADRQVREKHGELSFAWDPAAAEVFRSTLLPFYQDARTELARRYGFTPGPTTIEVFDRHADFSVRSTGFEGFPALGVCFGPVVTAVSPLAEMRGTQSWARTSFHEFTHVIHLGLSHNRCPRWITEGLATWEEENRSPTWTRNMRRELVDAIANGDVIPVRELNRAFRSQRILFGYYQGGLLCRMLIERAGFPPMVKILEAFDRGLDLDQAFAEVYRTTPEEVDRDFDAFVRKLTKDLSIEPRWTGAAAARARAGLSREKPRADLGPDALARWADAWCTVASHAWQQGKKVDAQEALRAIQTLDPQPARAQFLRGEIALQSGDRELAVEIWEAALAHGEDFRARVALGMLARDAGKIEDAERHLLAAERLFPGFDEPALSAELNLARLYEQNERPDDAMRAVERHLAWEAGDLEGRRKVADWHLEAKRFPEAAKHLREAIEIDPFLRAVHKDYGQALRAMGKHEEALAEFTIGIQVPQHLDADEPGPPEDEERAEWLGLQAACLQELGRTAEAIERARAALELDPDCAVAKETLERSQ